MNHQVDMDITRGLRRRGIDVVTATEDGAAQLDDEQLLERAIQLGRVLFTQDDDLLAIAHRWLQTGRDFSGLIYGHQLKVTIGRAIQDLELSAQVLDPEDMRNRVDYIPL
jgi:hypothetical protein